MWIELTLAGAPRRRRVAFGPLDLGALPPGQWRELTPGEVPRLAPAGPSFPSTA